MLFNKDFETLRIRLDELYEIVDLFVICESNYTFSGIPKALYLSENLDKFSEYTDKIKIVIERKKHLTNIPFIREIHQRKAISNYIKLLKISNSDLIIYSDCDEVPKSSTIKHLEGRSNCNVLLEMRHFTNYLNMELGVWARARVVSGKNYHSIEKMRQDIFLYNLKGRSGIKKYVTRIPYYWTTRNFYLWKLPKFFLPPNIEVIKNSGWHFNNLFPKEEILDKIRASAHTELNTDQANEKAIRNYSSGKDIYFGKQFFKVEVDDTYPTCVYNNLPAWQAYLFT
jgi:hypothetical protein